MTAKLLIVNADDFNTDSERNRGILHAVREGIVTTTSVIANQSWDRNDAIALGEALGGRVGIHLNLTRGFPLISGTKTLVDKTGRFLDKKSFWRKALLRRIDLQEVEAEFAAQMETLHRLNLSPDHIDGNNHIHIFPGIPRIAARLAHRFGITRIRLPCESFIRWSQYFKSNGGKKSLIGFLGRKAAPVFREYGLRWSDHFAGIQFPVVSKIDSLQSFLAQLLEGATELMCHPGHPCPGENPFSSVEREQELMALTDPVVRESLRRFEIRLISFGEI